jgi:lysozyme family protein
MTWTFEATAAGYRNLWKSAVLTPGDAAKAKAAADKIIAGEARYRTVQAATGVPWFLIGALHMREAACSFKGCLQNGDEIIGTGELTRHEPKGEGPFATWEDSAIQAMKDKGLQRVQSWPPERMLYSAEVYNGLGYVSHGENSPYVWASTNHEQRGKYVADGQYSATADDTQLGIAAMLLALADQRADIAAALAHVAPVMPPATPKPQQPATALPSVAPTTAPAPSVDLGQIVQVLGPVLQQAAKDPATSALFEGLFGIIGKYLPHIAGTGLTGVIASMGLGVLGTTTPAGIISLAGAALPLVITFAQALSNAASRKS